MISGIGIDLCDVERIRNALQRHGDHFASRILDPVEYSEFQSLRESQRPQFLAKRFAAKEAISKALGTGIGRGFGFRDLFVRHNELGRPVVKLNPKNKVLSDALPCKIHLSISDDRSHAIALCTIEI